MGALARGNGVHRRGRQNDRHGRPDRHAARAILGVGARRPRLGPADRTPFAGDDRPDCRNLGSSRTSSAGTSFAFATGSPPFVVAISGWQAPTSHGALFLHLPIAPPCSTSQYCWRASSFRRAPRSSFAAGLSVITRRLNLVFAVSLSSMLFTFLHFTPDQPWLVTANLVLFAVFACSWAITANNVSGRNGLARGMELDVATGSAVPRHRHRRAHYRARGDACAVKAAS